MSDSIQIISSRNDDQPDHIRIVYLTNNDTMAEEYTFKLTTKNSARVIIKRTWGGNPTRSRAISWAVSPPIGNSLQSTHFMGIVAHAGSLALKHECRQCQRGEGVFRECSVNTYWPYGSQNGACTSCAYLGRAAGCTLLDARRLYIGDTRENVKSEPDSTDDESIRRTASESEIQKILEMSRTGRSLKRNMSHIQHQDMREPPNARYPSTRGKDEYTLLTVNELNRKIRRIGTALETSPVINHGGLLTVDCEDEKEVGAATIELQGAIKYLQLKAMARQ